MAVRLQKTDSGMQSGVKAIQACEDHCKASHLKVGKVREDLKANWAGAASQQFLDQLQNWEADYQRVLRALTNIKETVQASDQSMNVAEENNTRLSVGAFGSESERVRKALS
jgi:WXG100 family type VII secretion target